MNPTDTSGRSRGRLWRFWRRLLSWGNPYMEDRLARNDPDALKKAIERAQRKGRLPEDPD